MADDYDFESSRAKRYADRINDALADAFEDDDNDDIPEIVMVIHADDVTVIGSPHHPRVVEWMLQNALELSRPKPTPKPRHQRRPN